MAYKVIKEYSYPVIGQEYDWVTTGAPTYKASDTHKNLNGYLVTFNHPVLRDGLREGGPFQIFLGGLEREFSSVVTVWRPGGKHPAYIGSFSAASPDFLSQTLVGDPLKSPAHDLGAQAWAKARARLTKPDFSPLQPLAEARELPKLLRNLNMDYLRRVFHPSNRVKLKTLGELHLANQFGWKPVWSDIASYLKAERGKQKRANQLIRDAGRPVRRRGDLFNQETDVTTVSDAAFSGGFSPALVSQCFKGGTRTVQRKRSFDKAWYSGRFKYWLPPGPGSPVEYRKKLESALAFNTQLTPTLAWNLIPWTWLIDWATGIGDFFDAVSKGVEDRLAADYFYVMYHKEFNNRLTQTFRVYTNKDGTEWETIVCSSERFSKMKDRAVASPFGFGLSGKPLSPMQWSILGALGASRL